MRWEVVAAQPEAAVGVAHGVREGRPAGDDEQRVALGQLPEHRAQRAQRVVPGAAPEPAADLDDRQHGACRRVASNAASAAAGATSPPSRPTARRIRDRSLQARGDLAPHEGAGADRDDRRIRRQRPLHAARRVLELAQLLAVQEGRDRVDLARVELLGVGAHQPGDALTRERERRGAAVGRGTVVRLRRQVAEDEMDVGADREALGRHRAATAADRHVRRDRREVGAQHAGVDELAGQQPLQVVVPGRGDASRGDRDDVGGRAADIDEQRVGVRVGHRERRRHPVGGGDVPRARPRRLHGHELAGDRQHAQRPGAERVLRGVEHERHPLALRPERVRELRGHRDRHGVRRAAGDLGGDVAEHRGQRRAVAPHLERTRDRAQRLPVEPGGLGVRAADVDC